MLGSLRGNVSFRLRIIKLCGFLGVTCLALTCARCSAQDEADPVLAVMELYQQELKQLRSRGSSESARMLFNREWRDRLDAVLKEHKDSQYWDVGVRELIGLNNGIGDYDRAAELASQLAEKATDVGEKITWLGERGEVARLSYITNNHKEDRDLAIVAFQDVLSLAYDGGLDELPSKVACRCAVYAGQLALLLVDVNTTESIAAAIEHLRRIRSYVDNSEDCNQEYATTDYGSEGLARLQISVAVRAKDANVAEEALAAIAKIAQSDASSLRCKFSQDVYAVAEGLYGEDSHGYQSIIDRWLNKTPADTWTPNLEFYLARSLFSDKKDARALPLYEKLAKSHKEHFIQLDREALRAGQGGYYAEILSNLSQIYGRAGNWDQSSQYADSFAKLYPNDPRVGAVDPAADLKRLKQSRETALSGAPHSAFWLCVNVGVVLACVCLLLIRRMRRAA